MPKNKFIIPACILLLFMGSVYCLFCIMDPIQKHDYEPAISFFLVIVGSISLAFFGLIANDLFQKFSARLRLNQSHGLTTTTITSTAQTQVGIGTVDIPDNWPRSFSNIGSHLGGMTEAEDIRQDARNESRLHLLTLADEYYPALKAKFKSLEISEEEIRKNLPKKEPVKKGPVFSRYDRILQKGKINIQNG